MCNNSYATMCEDCLNLSPNECEAGEYRPDCYDMEQAALADDAEAERFDPVTVPAYVPIDRVTGGPERLDSRDEDDEGYEYD